MASNESRPRRYTGAMSEVTRILEAIQAGQPQAASELLPLVYDELRQLAAAKLAQEKPGHTLDATVLVHEAYVRLVGDHAFADRSHFFRVAAEAMRRILIDHARQKRRIRHGGHRTRVALSDVELAAEAPADELLTLDEALDRFAAKAPVKAELVKLRYFVGFSEEEAATALGISRATASRYWSYARAWLINALDEKRE
ncbi:MAG TPA: ECF-type sigma factor [Pirellulales bacterium]|nr:ECF-type sigma factor [Pirellulales bacterium]